MQFVRQHDTGGVRNEKITLNKNNRPATKFASGLARVTKASAAAFQYGGPPSSYQTTRIYDTGRPVNRTEPGASTPAAAATGGTERPGSGDFSFGVPLVNLAGRGPDAGVGLFTTVWSGKKWVRLSL